MPPKKRALEDAPANAQPPLKRSANGKGVDDDRRSAEPSTAETCEEASRAQENRPIEQSTTESTHEKDEGNSSIWLKSASEHPDWKWVMMRESWTRLYDLRKRAANVNPDNFDMHINGDFLGCGLYEIMQDVIFKFANAWNNSEADNYLQHLWAIITSLGHWLNDEDVVLDWMSSADPEGRSEFIGLVGCAFLTVLELIDQADQLGPHSSFQDLRPVMCLHLMWSRDMQEFDIPDESLDWRKSVVASAKKGDIDLHNVGGAPLAQILGKSPLKNVKPLKATKTGGRWKWAKTFKEFHKDNRFALDLPLGLPSYDITQWPRKLRAKWNFDKKDPLAHIPEKDLKEGNVVLR